MSINAPSRRAPATNPALVEMWRSAIRKAQQTIPDPPVLPSVLTINFDGGGLPLVAGLAGLAEVTFPCRILGCHIYAGSALLEPIPVTATVELRLSAHGFWSSGSTPLYGTSSIPSITAVAETDVSVTGWIIDLQPGDLIPYQLVTFSGAATWLSVNIPLRRLNQTGTGVSDVLSGGDRLVDSDGNTVVRR